MDRDYKIQTIKKILKRKGYKMTNARIEIIKLFIKNKDNHYRVEDIYDLMKSRYVSMPTIYRTMDVLKGSDIIKETIIDNQKYYELKIFSRKSVHVHLKCIKCGDIFDYFNTKSSLLLLDEKTKIEDKYDMLIHDIYAVFYGICKKCGGELDLAKTCKT